MIVDEAGQIGARQLFDLLKLIESRGARVVLSGDTRQHGPVEASDALRAIERYSGLRSAELNEIRRQDPERARDEAKRTRIREYRAAVKAAAEGSLESSFDRLEQLGAITEPRLSGCGMTSQAPTLNSRAMTSQPSLSRRHGPKLTK